jgi:hypothetical protein
MRQKWYVLSVELIVGSKTVPNTVINGKVSYSLLLGRDWIHTNSCIPSTMHRVQLQWKGGQDEIVSTNTNVNVIVVDLDPWQMESANCLFARVCNGQCLNIIDELKESWGTDLCRQMSCKEFKRS